MINLQTVPDAVLVDHLDNCRYSQAILQRQLQADTKFKKLRWIVLGAAGGILAAAGITFFGGVAAGAIGAAVIWGVATTKGYRNLLLLKSAYERDVAQTADELARRGISLPRPSGAVDTRLLAAE